MAVDNRPDAVPVLLPSPAIDNEKMVANIMELQNPAKTIHQTEKCPWVIIEDNINIVAMKETTNNTFLL